jgi:DNA-binding beta-propeller fold protein YncE
LLVAILACSAPAAWAGTKKPARAADAPPPLELEGGRRLEFVREFSSESQVKPNKSIWSRVVDFVAGEAEVHRMVRPYGLAVDHQGRVLVTDPGALMVHVFDFQKKKYQSISGSGKEEFVSPIAIAVDDHDAIYVSDSALGKVFVFDARGKFKRFIGDIRGEGIFKRPTGIAIDNEKHRIYIADTLKNAVYFADLEGNVLGYFGAKGNGPGQFNYPTEITIRGNDVYVVDAMNFRVQRFDKEGRFQMQFGRMGLSTGSIFRAKGVALDHEGNLYLADAYLDMVQVFNPEGVLLYFFGRGGHGAAEFRLPEGVAIAASANSSSLVYVADSANRRIQVFRFVPPNSKTAGGSQ